MNRSAEYIESFCCSAKKQSCVWIVCVDGVIAFAAIQCVGFIIDMPVKAAAFRPTLFHCMSKVVQNIVSFIAFDNIGTIATIDLVIPGATRQGVRRSTILPV